MPEADIQKHWKKPRIQRLHRIQPFSPAGLQLRFASESQGGLFATQTKWAQSPEFLVQKVWGETQCQSRSQVLLPPGVPGPHFEKCSPPTCSLFHGSSFLSPFLTPAFLPLSHSLQASPLFPWTLLLPPPSFVPTPAPRSLPHPTFFLSHGELESLENQNGCEARGTTSPSPWLVRDTSHR